MEMWQQMDFYQGDLIIWNVGGQKSIQRAKSQHEPNGCNESGGRDLYISFRLVKFRQLPNNFALGKFNPTSFFPESWEVQTIAQHFLFWENQITVHPFRYWKVQTTNKSFLARVLGRSNNCPKIYFSAL